MDQCERIGSKHETAKHAKKRMSSITKTEAPSYIIDRSLLRAQTLFPLRETKETEL